jgi:uncharacterized protein involved in response to NO
MKCPLSGMSLNPGAPLSPMEIPPLWRLGFRPFFLGGALFGLAGIGLWLVALAGGLSGWTPLGGWLGWHRHEMPFGFAAAIIAGFLLTAMQNWTGRPSLRGRPLLVLVGLWGAARLCWLLGVAWPLTATVEAAFWGMLAISAGRLLWRTRQKHNVFAPGTILLLGLADALSFAGVAAAQEEWQRHAAMAAIWLIVALMTMIGGRVIPFFTQQDLGQPQRVVAWLWLDVALMAGALALAALAAMGQGDTPGGGAWAFPFGLLAAGHALRLWRWRAPGIGRAPLLWSLYLASFWMILGYGGMMLLHAGYPMPPSIALHTLTVGSMGGLILAMMSRVSLAHTGRPLTASRSVTWAFALLNLGAASRTLLTFWWPLTGIFLAACFWMAAFGLFTLRYAPMLCHPRVDGAPE